MPQLLITCVCLPCFLWPRPAFLQLALTWYKLGERVREGEWGCKDLILTISGCSSSLFSTISRHLGHIWPLFKWTHQNGGEFGDCDCVFSAFAPSGPSMALGYVVSNLATDFKWIINTQLPPHSLSFLWKLTTQYIYVHFILYQISNYENNHQWQMHISKQYFTFHLWWAWNIKGLWWYCTSA